MAVTTLAFGGTSFAQPAASGAPAVEKKIEAAGEKAEDATKRKAKAKSKARKKKTMKKPAQKTAESTRQKISEKTGDMMEKKRNKCALGHTFLHPNCQASERSATTRTCDDLFNRAFQIPWLIYPNHLIRLLVRCRDEPWVPAKEVW